MRQTKEDRMGLVTMVPKKLRMWYWARRITKKARPTLIKQRRMLRWWMYGRRHLKMILALFKEVRKIRQVRVCLVQERWPSLRPVQVV
jgi:hypothetical protein